MTTSRRSSNASPPLRLDLTGSRSLSACLVLVGVLGGVGLFLTELPWLLALPAALLAAVWGVALARQEWRRPLETLVLYANGSVSVDGEAVEAFRLAPQGPLTRLEWTSGGRRHRRVAWPDVFDAAARRELRLWALGRDVRVSTAAVAP